MVAVDEPLLASLGFLAAAVVTLADGRNAVGVAALVSGLCLAPLAADVAGGDATLLLVGLAALSAALLPLARRAGRRARRTAGLDPGVPVVSTGENLFGPRSIRVAAGAATLPAASWVSFNVPIGTATTVSGVLFPAVLICLCGGVRLLAARTLTDVAVGVAVVGLAAGVGWAVAGGVENLDGLAAAAGLAPAAALAVGWLSGRHAATT
ncbi:MAG: hypothetical protein ACYDAC_10310 [Candidatus Dormibacteria bacterium]